MVVIETDNLKIIAIPCSISDDIRKVLNVEVAEDVLKLCKVCKIIGKLTEFTETEYDEILDWSEFDEGQKLYKNYHTENFIANPKLCLRSLFTSNKLFIKEWLGKRPEMNHWGASSEVYDQYYEDCKCYDETPEDYLIIKIEIN